MAESVTIGGISFAADEVGGSQYQRVKISFGADGAAQDVDASHAFPVADSAVATLLTQGITIAAQPLPPGAATAAGQAAGNASLAAGEPVSKAAAITPSDSAALSTTSRALYVGGGGDITLRLSGDSADVVFKAVPAGALLPLKVTNVRSSGTTATSIVALA